MTRAILVLAGLIALAGCGGNGGNTLGTSQQVQLPSLQYRNNPSNVPGFVAPCAGGQPQMQYNCPSARN